MNKLKLFVAGIVVDTAQIAQRPMGFILISAGNAGLLLLAMWGLRGTESIQAWFPVKEAAFTLFAATIALGAVGVSGGQTALTSNQLQVRNRRLQLGWTNQSVVKIEDPLLQSLKRERFVIQIRTPIILAAAVSNCLILVSFAAFGFAQTVAGLVLVAFQFLYLGSTLAGAVRTID